MVLFILKLEGIWRFISFSKVNVIALEGEGLTTPFAEHQLAAKCSSVSDVVGLQRRG